MLLHAEEGSEYLLSLEAEVGIGGGAIAELDLDKVYCHLARSQHSLAQKAPLIPPSCLWVLLWHF